MMTPHDINVWQHGHCRSLVDPNRIVPLIVPFFSVSSHRHNIEPFCGTGAEREYNPGGEGAYHNNNNVVVLATGVYTQHTNATERETEGINRFFFKLIDPCQPNLHWVATPRYMGKREGRKFALASTQASRRREEGDEGGQAEENTGGKAEENTREKVSRSNHRKIQSHCGGNNGVF